MVAVIFNTIRLNHFRNLTNLELRPGPHFNVFSGHNGAGKSNVLEAIYYLSALQSFRTNNNATLIQHGQSQAALFAQIASEHVAHTLCVMLNEQSGRQIELDAKRPRARSTWLRTVPAVLFHPGDLCLVSGSAEHRRDWIDRILEQIDPIFATTAAAYDRALRSRNRMIKDGVKSHAAFAAYNEILADAGKVIAQSRAGIVGTLGPRTTQNFQKIFSQSAQFEIVYRPNTEPQQLLKALETSLQEDMARGYTTKGVHRDELDVLFNDSLAREFASQGQQRSIALALKLAELDLLAKTTGKTPVLLLDDVSSELDNTRNEQLFALLAELGGQVFLSTTHPEFIRIDSRRADFNVCNGVIENQTRTSPVLSRSAQRRQG